MEAFLGFMGIARASGVSGSFNWNTDLGYPVVSFASALGRLSD